MKKIVALILASVAALSVAACAGKGKAPIGKGKTPPPPVVTKG